MKWRNLRSSASRLIFQILIVAITSCGSESSQLPLQTSHNDPSQTVQKTESLGSSVSHGQCTKALENRRVISTLEKLRSGSPASPESMSGQLEKAARELAADGSLPETERRALVLYLTVTSQEMKAKEAKRNLLRLAFSHLDGADHSIDAAMIALIRQALSLTGDGADSPLAQVSDDEVAFFFESVFLANVERYASILAESGITHKRETGWRFPGTKLDRLGTELGMAMLQNGILTYNMPTRERFFLNTKGELESYPIFVESHAQNSAHQSEPVEHSEFAGEQEPHLRIDQDQLRIFIQKPFDELDRKSDQLLRAFFEVFGVTETVEFSRALRISRPFEYVGKPVVEKATGHTRVGYEKSFFQAPAFFLGETVFIPNPDQKSWRQEPAAAYLALMQKSFGDYVDASERLSRAISAATFGNTVSAEASAFLTNVYRATPAVIKTIGTLSPHYFPLASNAVLLEMRIAAERYASARGAYIALQPTVAHQKLVTYVGKMLQAQLRDTEHRYWETHRQWLRTLPLIAALPLTFAIAPEVAVVLLGPELGTLAGGAMVTTFTTLVTLQLVDSVATSMIKTVARRGNPTDVFCHLVSELGDTGPRAIRDATKWSVLSGLGLPGISALWGGAGTATTVSAYHTLSQASTLFYGINISVNAGMEFWNAAAFLKQAKELEASAPEEARMAREAGYIAAFRGTLNTFFAAKIGHGLQKKWFPASPEEALSRSLTPEQKNAIKIASTVGQNQTGRDGTAARSRNFTFAQLRDKARVLHDAGFSRSEVRLLMSSGFVDVVGKLEKPATEISSQELDLFKRPEGAIAADNSLAARSRRILQRPLTSREVSAVNEAHQVGANDVGADGKTMAGVGNYTTDQIARKTRILKDAGFSVTERRALLESGTAGVDRAPAAASISEDLARGRVVDARPILGQEGRQRYLWVKVLNPKTGIEREAVFSLDRMRFYQKPIVVAHGKNDNIATESTWKNLEHSVQNGANVLEVDIQMTRDGRFVMLHDPTFHRLMPGYQTSPERVAELQRANPALYESKKGAMDLGLVDRVSAYDGREIGHKFYIHDAKQGQNVSIITLAEMLNATKRPTAFVIPEHTVTAATGSQTRVEPTRIVPTDKPVLWYLDMKDINPLARRLEGLSSWDWIRNQWSTAEMQKYTRSVVENLSRELTAANAHDRVYIAVRHPEIARMVREIDPKIKMMASPEGATADLPAAAFVEKLKAFAPYQPEFIEVKYLRHITAPEVRQAIAGSGAKIMYNQIVQTDPSQFQGVYQNNLPRLLSDILRAGPDIMIQTNTVKSVADYVKTHFSGSSEAPPAERPQPAAPSELRKVSGF